MNWNDVRAEFPALSGWTYLNTATYGQVPLRSQRAVADHFARRNELACTDFMHWFDDADEIRGLIGKLIHCDAADVSFTSTAAAALSLFLGGLDWQPGDRIVTLAGEFPNQFYYGKWLHSKGVELLEKTRIDSLPERTRAVVISTVNYTTGYRPDVSSIAKLAHGNGALLYVDATQSLGALRFDVRETQPDMLGCDPYKWLITPNGASFFYISPELRERIAPTVIGWRSDKGWRSVEELSNRAPQFPDGAERYEAGMLNFPSLYGLAESVRMQLEIGPAVIEERVLELAGKASAILQNAGATIVNPDSNIVAARFADRDLAVLAKSLREKKIVIAQRHGNLRVSPHFYNNEDDLSVLANALQVST